MPRSDAPTIEATASEKLHHALRLADLFNWADAPGPTSARRRRCSPAAGDRRNALYARLGVIRSDSEQHPLPETSAQLGKNLESNPILHSDKELRMFCLMVKGDIDGELDARAMREDWQQVAALARDLRDVKWQYRALAQLEIAAFYDGDLETARKNVGGALAEATKNGDTGAQIRYLTALGNGLVQSRIYDHALPYFDSASKIAAASPDAGFQFNMNERRVMALTGLRQLDAAQRLVDEIMARAQQEGKFLHQAEALNLAGVYSEWRHSKKAEMAKPLSLKAMACGFSLRMCITPFAVGKTTCFFAVVFLNCPFYGCAVAGGEVERSSCSMTYPIVL